MLVFPDSSEVKVKDALVTVIVPVYNVAQYLDRCVESIVNQTYANLQVILVNDGSTDGSGALCDEYANRDERVTVIHQANGGLSAARNAALDSAGGDFITFVDSDDWIHQQFVERLLSMACIGPADIAIAGLIKPPLDAISADFDREIPVLLTPVEAIDQLLGPNHPLFVVACGKLFRRRVLGDLRFPTGRLHEDEFIAHRLILAANRISLVHEPLYYYWQRETSIMGAGYNIRRGEDIVQAYRDRVDVLESVGMHDAASRTRKSLFFQTRKLFLSMDAKNVTRRKELLRDMRKIASDEARIRRNLLSVFVWLYSWIPGVLEPLDQIRHRLRKDGRAAIEWLPTRLSLRASTR